MEIKYHYWLDGKKFEKTATMRKGTPKSDAPKSYKKLYIASHNIGNAYNPHHMDVYQRRDGRLVYAIYRDGCFFQYFGLLDNIKDTNSN